MALAGRAIRRPLGQELAIEDDPSILEIGNAGTKWDERPPSFQILDLEQVASSIIFDRNDRADGFPAAIDGWKSDEVGVIIFAFGERRQVRAVDLDKLASKSFS